MKLLKPKSVKVAIEKIDYEDCIKVLKECNSKIIVIRMLVIIYFLQL